MTPSFPRVSKAFCQNSPKHSKYVEGCSSKLLELFQLLGVVHTDNGAQNLPSRVALLRKVAGAVPVGCVVGAVDVGNSSLNHVH